MTIRLNRLVRPLLTAALVGTLSFAWAADAKPADHADATQHHAAMMQKMEEHAAKRLNLTTDQQAAWHEYTGTLESAMADMHASMHKEMGEHKDFDAATAAHMHADRAAAMAQRMSKIADATDKFEKVLNPDQKKTFNEMARHFMHRHGHNGWHHHGHHHGWDHEGWDHHDGDHDKHEDSKASK
jgi:Spy/CpxP family protein refolding chaperone